MVRYYALQGRKISCKAIILLTNKNRLQLKLLPIVEVKPTVFGRRIRRQLPQLSNRGEVVCNYLSRNADAALGG